MTREHVGLITIDVEKDLRDGRSVSTQMRMVPVPEGSVTPHVIQSNKAYNDAIRRVYSLLSMVSPEDPEQVRAFKEGLKNYVESLDR